MLMLIVGIVLMLIALGVGGLLQLHWRTATDRRPQQRVHAQEVFIDGNGAYIIFELEPLDESERVDDYSAPRRAS